MNNVEKKPRAVKLHTTANIPLAKQMLALLTKSKLPGRITYSVQNARQTAVVETSSRVLAEAKIVRDKLLAVWGGK